LDDVRDSTRIAAIGFTKVLSQQIVKACSPDLATGNDSQKYNLEQSVDNSKGSYTKSLNKLGQVDSKSILDATTAVIVPILLDRGLVASSPEGRGFSLGLLVQLVKVIHVQNFYHVLK
jgi:hypothetical protein